MSGVPYVFGNATTSIPLSQLDVNFATNATIGTTSVGLGNTTTTLVGLTNVSTTVVNTSNVSANTSLLLQTNGGTTAVTIDTSQKVTFANSIGFGSNAGITFNNSSALTNSTLNDYETGTWTPNQGSGLTVTGTFSSSGSYTKIGRLVLINFKMTATTLTCAGSAIISSNLPFATPSDTIGYYGAGTNGAGTATNTFEVYVGNLYSNTALTGTTQIYGTIVYNATF